ncbi:MAG: M23 family metallopeptidase [Nonlabens sp.]
MSSRYLLIWIFLFGSIFFNGMEAQVYKFDYVKKSDTLNFYYKNYLAAPVTVFLENIKKERVKVPKAKLVVMPQDSLTNIIQIPDVSANKEDDFDISQYVKINMKYGRELDLDSIRDFPYELPFPKKKKYKIIQGFNGTFTHNKASSRYAVDFKIAVGDTISAARPGIVINTKDQFKEHGGKSFRNKANQIIIYHDDGTMAFYVHFDYEGVLVELGDRVEAGQAIGISGWTGYSTTPHLHFVVRNFNTSIPIRFRKGRKLGRKKGKWARN